MDRLSYSPMNGCQPLSIIIQTDLFLLQLVLTIDESDAADSATLVALLKQRVYRTWVWRLRHTHASEKRCLSHASTSDSLRSGLYACIITNAEVDRVVCPIGSRLEC